MTAGSGLSYASSSNVCWIPIATLYHTDGGGETANKDCAAYHGIKYGRGKRAAPQFRSISRPNIPTVTSSLFEIGTITGEVEDDGEMSKCGRTH